MKPGELVSKAHGAAVATDVSNRLLEWNEAAEELLALEAKGAERGKNFAAVIDALDSFGNRLPAGDTPFLGMTQRGEPVRGFEITALDSDDERIRISVLPVVMMAPSRRESAIVYFLRPMLRRRRADEAIERILAGSAPALADLGLESKTAATTLTERQHEILRHVAEGLSNAEIARVLNISINTVRTHVQSLLERLEVHSRVEAVAKAFRDGLL